MHTASTPDAHDGFSLDLIDPAKLAAAIRTAYALGWRDRRAVEAAVTAGDLVAIDTTNDDPPSHTTEALYLRIARGV